MPTFAKFDVVVWVKKTDGFPALREELIGLAVQEPDQAAEHQGLVELHWGFDIFAEAESVAAAFAMLRDRPEIVLLRISSLADVKESFTFKDTRHMGR